MCACVRLCVGVCVCVSVCQSVNAEMRDKSTPHSTLPIQALRLSPRILFLITLAPHILPPLVLRTSSHPLSFVLYGKQWTWIRIQDMYKKEKKRAFGPARRLLLQESRVLDLCDCLAVTAQILDPRK